MPANEAYKSIYKQKKIRKDCCMTCIRIERSIKLFNIQIELNLLRVHSNWVRQLIKSI